MLWLLEICIEALGAKGISGGNLQMVQEKKCFGMQIFCKYVIF